MQRTSLAELEIRRHDWGRLRCGCGDGKHMAESLRSLITATSVEEAGKVDFSHHTEIGGLLFEVAVPAASVMMAALADGVSEIAESAILNRIWRIADAEPHFTEAALGREDLRASVQSAIREGIWSLYRALAGPSWRRAEDIIGMVDIQNARFDYFESELRFLNRF